MRRTHRGYSRGTPSGTRSTHSGGIPRPLRSQRAAAGAQEVSTACSAHPHPQRVCSLAGCSRLLLLLLLRGARAYSLAGYPRPTDARTAAQSRPCARRRRSRRRRAETQSRAPAMQTCGRHARCIITRPRSRGRSHLERVRGAFPLGASAWARTRRCAARPRGPTRGRSRRGTRARACGSTRRMGWHR
jgi:hypothetical protein